VAILLVCWGVIVVVKDGGTCTVSAIFSLLFFVVVIVFSITIGVVGSVLTGCC